MERQLQKWQETSLRVCGILLAVAIWKGLALWLGEFRLPAPETIVRAMWINLTESPILEMQGGGSNGVWPHLLYTFERTLVGSAIGVTFGVVCGLLLGYSRWLRVLLEAPIETMRTVPPLAAIPFFLMWFGPTQTAQLSMMAFYCFFMLLINTISGIANVNPIYLDYATTLGASRAQTFRTVILPAIIPELVGGIRVAIGVSWGIQIVAELMGAQQGMGQVFSMAMPMQALDLIIAAILWITLLAAMTDLLFVWGARAVTRWMPVHR